MCSTGVESLCNLPLCSATPFLVQESADSRTYGGVHFPSANYDGLKLGKLIASKVYDRCGCFVCCFCMGSAGSQCLVGATGGGLQVQLDRQHASLTDTGLVSFSLPLFEQTGCSPSRSSSPSSARQQEAAAAATASSSDKLELYALAVSRARGYRVCVGCACTQRPQLYCTCARRRSQSASTCLLATSSPPFVLGV